MKKMCMIVTTQGCVVVGLSMQELLRPAQFWSRWKWDKRRGEEEEEQFFRCAEVQIHQADFTCPPWFSPAACRFILQILDPNPKTLSVHAVQIVSNVMHHMNGDFKVCVLCSLPSSKMCSMWIYHGVCCGSGKLQRKFTRQNFGEIR
jgi:hypothetical protein